MQASFAVQELDLAFALLGFAQLAFGFLALDGRDFVAQPALAVEKGRVVTVEKN